MRNTWKTQTQSEIGAVQQITAHCTSHIAAQLPNVLYCGGDVTVANGREGTRDETEHAVALRNNPFKEAEM